MTKAAALYKFFASFGLPAYEENSVYAMENPVYPYITYENRTGYFDMMNDIPISFSLWYRSASLKDAHAKSQQIATAVGRRGLKLPVDGGYLWIKRPDGQWGIDMGDDSDDMVKRINHSLILNFYTND